MAHAVGLHPGIRPRSGRRTNGPAPECRRRRVGIGTNLLQRRLFFSVDEDIEDDTWNTVAVEWFRGVNFRGINSVLGVHRTGIYGHSCAGASAITDGVIGRSTTPDHWWAWQTKAWSAGER
ncbi:hypothetical protein MDOR_10960 [Mycolicibacterium doricum]|uniref:Rv2525c-like glycoside hydrolase-like domain-containing protein n=1 Tax=Mycolicibacterium doricum TaxID=126673 RepID=A0A7I7VPV6_9MYCO|nr:hypothetical protein MDOR_10960 [Mycolicibacterium doricum]